MNRFDYFVVLAEMRTGSNFLEANLNLLDGVTCHGEAFNPSFLGYPKTEELLGCDMEGREADPLALLARIKDSDQMGGFRFFHNHDPRVRDEILADPRCAKIILTRNPVDSYISWKIAQSTGQWKLTNATHSKSHTIDFDQDGFEAHLEALLAFQADIQRQLQVRGQSAFYIGYDDLRDLDVVNGIPAFLGLDARLSNINKKLKKQNPEPLSQKVRNFEEMQTALTQIDRFDLGRTPNFEPKRGPSIPTYFAAPESGLMYMPLRSGPDRAVKDWLSALDGGGPVLRKFSQRTLRDWQSEHRPHRSFTVLRHPVARAHAAFCDRILLDGNQSFPEIRANLRRVHKLPIPEAAPDLSKTAPYDVQAHKTAFLAFLKFLRNNLFGQTSIRVDPSWASQQVLLEGMAQFALPDVLLREDQLDVTLPQLTQQIGLDACPAIGDCAHVYQDWLAAIYDARIEEAAQDAYARDYTVFGFDAWA